MSSVQDEIKYLDVHMDETVKGINQEAQSRARRSVNVMRNSALRTLQAKGSGRVYKVPGTYGRQATKNTKTLMHGYGHKLRGGQLHQASAPGEVPATLFGHLRKNWNQQVLGESNADGGVTITARLKSDMPYSDWLDEGTSKIAPRPYKQKIIDDAKPKIDAIYAKPFMK
jgi:hypothetical protein